MFNSLRLQKQPFMNQLAFRKFFLQAACICGTVSTHVQYLYSKASAAINVQHLNMLLKETVDMKN